MELYNLLKVVEEQSGQEVTVRLIAPDTHQPLEVLGQPDDATTEWINLYLTLNKYARELVDYCYHKDMAILSTIDRIGKSIPKLLKHSERSMLLNVLLYWETFSKTLPDSDTNIRCELSIPSYYTQEHLDSVRILLEKLQGCEIINTSKTAHDTIYECKVDKDARLVLDMLNTCNAINIIH